MTEPHRGALPTSVAEKLEEILQPRHGVGAVTQLPLKRLVADYCEKWIAIDSTGAPAAFIVVSPRTHPSSVKDAADSATMVRAALGDPLGASVLVPLFVGEVDGCSYSITSYCRPMSSGRLRGRWQRWRAGPLMLTWVAEVTRQTAIEITAGETDHHLAALRSLESHASVRLEVRAAACKAIEDLASASWRPRSVIAHNDLWWGNFVHRERQAEGDFPFYVIDWGGARRNGTPFYDLVRMAMSLNLDPGAVRRELVRHCDILSCRPRDCLHYLSVALGTLSLNLGEWPPEQFARTASACLEFASASVTR